MSNTKKKAVIVFFVIPNDKRKWINSNERKNIQKLIEAPVIHDKHSINGYAIILNKYDLDAVRCQAALYDIKMYKEFVEYSNAKAPKMAYHIQHYHNLCKVYQIPPKCCPQGWGNIDKIANIIEKIKSENSGLRVYYKKYNIIHHKLLSIFNEHLIAIERGIKLFEIRPNWKGIPYGKVQNIATIFKESKQQKNMIYPAIKHHENPYHAKMNKNKRKKKKKQNKKLNNIRHVNAYILEANNMIKNNIDHTNIEKS